MGKKIDLTKSIDTLIDELFAEQVEKSLDGKKDSDRPENLNPGKMSATADEAVGQAPKGQMDQDRGAGRPEQISEVPQIDEDGKRAGKYDDDIVKKTSEEGEEPEEAKKQADAKRSDQTMGKQLSEKPAGAPFGKAISESEYAEYQALKKTAQAQKNEEVLRKAKEEQKSLIKSAVKEATAEIAKENEKLRKSLDETQQLVKAMAERPQRRKSIDGIQALEKSQSDSPKGPEHFSKSEMLDVAEELVMKSQANKDMIFRDEHLIELENTGYIYDRGARAAFEEALNKRK